MDKYEWTLEVGFGGKKGWNEADHPRIPKGQPGGGRFTAKPEGEGFWLNYGGGERVWVSTGTKYDPSQPRVPAGSAGGGQWTSGDRISRFLETGRSDRRVGRDEESFYSKIVEPLTQYDDQFIWGSLSDMELGPKEYAVKQGTGSAATRRRMTWARDAGLLEKVGKDYKLTPLGRAITSKGKTAYMDHIALMTGQHDMLLNRVDPKAAAYWLYANWPKTPSRITVGELGPVWHKVTGGKVGSILAILPRLERDRAIAYEKIADLHQVGLNPAKRLEDFT